MDFDIFDVHHHVGDARAVMALSEENPEPLDAQSYRKRELEERLAIMDEGGVHQALVIPGHGYGRPRGIADTRVENDRIAAYRDARPDRFPAAAGVVEPRDGEASLEEIERCAELPEGSAEALLMGQARPQTGPIGSALWRRGGG